MKADHFFTQHLEPFGEPRTMPGGWDLSSLDDCPSAPDGHHPPAPDRHAPAISKHGAAMPVQFAASPEAFLPVSTFPDHWDLSDLLKSL